MRSGKATSRNADGPSAARVTSGLVRVARNRFRLRALPVGDATGYLSIAAGPGVFYAAVGITGLQLFGSVITTGAVAG